MSDDIVERLRAMKSPSFEYVEPDADGMTTAKWVPTALAQEAADEIERLRAHVDRCPYGPLGEEWWCTHIPAHENDECYEEDGNTVKR